MRCSPAISRLMRRAALTLPVSAVLATAPMAAAAACTVKAVEMPVTMRGLRPMVHGRINGIDALFIADSGAFYSTLTRAAADQFKLPLEPAPFGFELMGVGGEAQAWLTHVRTFTLLDFPFANVDFLVTGNEFGQDAVGLLGQNVFRAIGDVEYDLASGVIRLMRTKDCRNSPMAYWATSLPYSVIDIDYPTAAQPYTTSSAYLNAAKIRVIFDTGATTSLLTLEAAKRAGVTPESPGVVPAGESHGIGRRLVKTWIAPFASFKIGDEEVRNTHLRIGAGTLLKVDMLIGADFFLSHRIYVANSQRKLYFTYNGGPVFNLTTSPELSGDRASGPPGAATGAGAARGAGTDAATPAASGSAPPGAPPPDESAPQPSDASGFARRGAAFAARHDFGHAIADLTRACELAPQEPGYFYERAMAYWGNRQPDLAMADLNHALTLEPKELPALVARADMHLRRDEVAAAITDLDAADRAAARQADVRLHLADQYLFAGQLAAAVKQATLWIDTHPHEDVQMPRARNLRCWARALAGEQLDEALRDCNTALRLRPDTAAFLDSRGLVYLRRGEYDRAIADYDRAIELRSQDAWSYYGRGVAKLRKGRAADGQADIAAAKALRPKIAEEAAQHGVGP